MAKPTRKFAFGTTNRWGRKRRPSGSLDPAYDPHRKLSWINFELMVTIVRQRAMRRPWGPRVFTYLLVGKKPWVRKAGPVAGTVGFYWEWEGDCAQCGSKFICTSPPEVGRPLPRTCENCDYRGGRPKRGEK